MAGLLDFAQAASNSAAGNVAGPIDMLAWGLRKMGLPIPNDPVLGTEWMKQKGLIKEVPQSPASLAGETLGLLSPIVAAAKAPQIAGGLLQMGDNLTTAKTLGSGPGGGQKGAIVYHGSPHKFDKFDSSKIGTGEGAQAYGHGLYLAESPAVSKNYMTPNTYASESASIGGKPYRDWIDSIPGTKAGERGAVSNVLSAADSHADVVAALQNSDLSDGARKLLQEAVNKGVTINRSGNLYKVDLPDEHIAKMLDWDKPLSQQGALKSNNVMQGFLPDETGAEIYRVLSKELAGGSQFVSGKNDAAAEALRQAGIPGIRYLDGASRGAGQGTSNFVVFPGNEGLLTILERNGAPLR